MTSIKFIADDTTGENRELVIPWPCKIKPKRRKWHVLKAGARERRERRGTLDSKSYAPFVRMNLQAIAEQFGLPYKLLGG